MCSSFDIFDCCAGFITFLLCYVKLLDGSYDKARWCSRYPTKEWKSLGTFHARDERSVQTFPVQDATMFGKYLRVDMMSHYGTEHFCPLTVLR